MHAAVRGSAPHAFVPRAPVPTYGGGVLSGSLGSPSRSCLACGDHPGHPIHRDACGAKILAAADEERALRQHAVLRDAGIRWIDARTDAGRAALAAA